MSAAVPLGVGELRGFALFVPITEGRCGLLFRFPAGRAFRGLVTVYGSWLRIA